MKKNILLLFSAFMSCNPVADNGEKDSFKLAGFPLPVSEQNSLLAQWEKKPVSETSLVDDMESGTGWEVRGIGEMSYTKDRSKDGVQSLRFRTSLRDEEHYKNEKNRSEWGSFIGGQGGGTCVLKQFDTPQDWSAFNRLSFWVYVHPTSSLTYCLNMGFNDEGFVENATTPRYTSFVQDLKPGVWNHVLFEMHHLKRDKVLSFKIDQMLIGHNPGEEGIVTFDIDKIELQKVEADQYEGWNVAPGKFAFSHIGYRPGDRKIAFVDTNAGKNFQVLDRKGNVVFSGEVQPVETTKGKFHQIDFSGLYAPGEYCLRCGTLVSGYFPVNENIWLQPVASAVNFLFCERCGYPVPGIHTVCHKDWQGFRGDEKKIINGGWHDAGDLSQGFWRTAMAVYSLISNLETLENQKVTGELPHRILSEIEWGLDYLLKTRFGDGYHMSWSMMRIYTDNQIGTIDDVVSPAQNVPWENFLSAAVLGKAHMFFEKTDPVLASKCLSAATEDWQAALDSRDEWSQASLLEASWGATSSIILNKISGGKEYNEKAVAFGNLVIQCQEQSFVDSIPVTGYFYGSTDRKQVIHNYHAAFEEAPLIALSMLCRSYPEDANWIKWYSAAVLHSEFFMKRGSRIASPYDHLPNSVWKKSEILAVKDPGVRGDMLRQFSEGMPLNDEYALRTFPIYSDNLFHGNTCVQMSDSWALAESSRLRNDPDGMQLVGKQLQWVLGVNPFGQSLMYGVGYDFAPQFAYCLKNVVGSLPVGMDCMSGDKPYWAATNNATSKEIWVEPVNRFLGTVSIYAAFNPQILPDHKKAVSIQAETIQSDHGTVSVILTLKGTGTHDIGISTFNAASDFTGKQIDLHDNKTEKILLELKVLDRAKPYIAVVSVDRNPDLKKEIVGSYNMASLYK